MKVLAFCLGLFKLGSAINSTFVTCDEYKSVFDKTFCLNRANGNYPFNDDACALFYNCWDGATFCQSCDELSNGDTPLYVHLNDGDYGLCERPGNGFCPTPGYPTNFIYQTTTATTDVTTESSTTQTTTESTTDATTTEKTTQESTTVTDSTTTEETTTNSTIPAEEELSDSLFLDLSE